MSELNTNIAKDLSWNPTTLLTGNFNNDATGTWKYINIPTLSKYQEVEIWTYVGDTEIVPYRINRAYSNTISVTGRYINQVTGTNYSGSIKVLIDFDNNRIGLYTVYNQEWNLSNMGIQRVLGLKLV